MSSIAFPAQWGVPPLGPNCSYSEFSPAIDELIKHSDLLDSSYGEMIDFIDFCFRIGEDFGKAGVEEAEYHEGSRSLGIDMVITESCFEKLSRNQVIHKYVSLAAQKISSLGVEVSDSFPAEDFLRDVDEILNGLVNQPKA